MTGDRRRTNAELKLTLLEAAYQVRLKMALVQCADGVWGLFGQNEHLPGAPASADAAELFEMADGIDAVRASLGMPPFEIHARFVAIRGRQGANQLGEPKLARAWLDEDVAADAARLAASGPYTCPVCAYPHLYEAPRNSNGGASFEYCPSCDFHFGVTDDDLGWSYDAWRARWIEDGMLWSHVGSDYPKPEPWDPEAQLAGLPKPN